MSALVDAANKPPSSKAYVPGVWHRTHVFWTDHLELVQSNFCLRGRADHSIILYSYKYVFFPDFFLSNLKFVFLQQLVLSPV